MKTMTMITAALIACGCGGSSPTTPTPPGCFESDATCPDSMLSIAYTCSDSVASSSAFQSWAESEVCEPTGQMLAGDLFVVCCTE
jgi:hypothetical protein